MVEYYLVLFRRIDFGGESPDCRRPQRRRTPPAALLVGGCWTHRAYCSRQGYHWSYRGAIMSDKSPRQHMAKKQGKTIKEKRADKKDKANAAASMEPVSRVAKR
jgi:hypothetical protein